jgi:hypothetical protein
LSTRQLPDGFLTNDVRRKAKRRTTAKGHGAILVMLQEASVRWHHPLLPKKKVTWISCSLDATLIVKKMST